MTNNRPQNHRPISGYLWSQLRKRLVGIDNQFGNFEVEAIGGKAVSSRTVWTVAQPGQELPRRKCRPPDMRGHCSASAHARRRTCWPISSISPQSPRRGRDWSTFAGSMSQRLSSYVEGIRLVDIVRSADWFRAGHAQPRPYGHRRSTPRVSPLGGALISQRLDAITVIRIRHRQSTHRYMQSVGAIQPVSEISRSSAQALARQQNDEFVDDGSRMQDDA